MEDWLCILKSKRLPQRDYLSITTLCNVTTVCIFLIVTRYFTIVYNSYLCAIFLSINLKHNMYMFFLLRKKKEKWSRQCYLSYAGLFKDSYNHIETKIMLLIQQIRHKPWSSKWYKQLNSLPSYSHLHCGQPQKELSNNLVIHDYNADDMIEKCSPMKWYIWVFFLSSTHYFTCICLIHNKSMRFVPHKGKEGLLKMIDSSKILFLEITSY